MQLYCNRNIGIKLQYLYEIEKKKKIVSKNSFTFFLSNHFKVQALFPTIGISN